MIKLKYYRELFGLSQAELSKKISISQQSISAYENGTREPDITTINLMCDFFKITSDELLGRDIKNEKIQIAASMKDNLDLSDMSESEKKYITDFVNMVRNNKK